MVVDILGADLQYLALLVFFSHQYFIIRPSYAQPSIDLTYDRSRRQSVFFPFQLVARPPYSILTLSLSNCSLIRSPAHTRPSFPPSFTYLLTLSSTMADLATPSAAMMTTVNAGADSQPSSSPAPSARPTRPDEEAFKLGLQEKESILEKARKKQVGDFRFLAVPPIL